MEFNSEKLIVISPMPRDSVDFGTLRYEVRIDVDPNYAHKDFDDPITLKECGSQKEPEMCLYPEDAEALGRALIRAADIRRRAVAEFADPTHPFNKLTTPEKKP